MKRLFSLLLISMPALAWQPINNLNQISKEITKELPGVDPKRVLLVFDIDETLIQTPEYRGSTQWFDDHAEQLKTSTKFASSFEELLGHNTVIKSGIDMKPTQPDMKDIVKELQSHYSSMALTSRGPGLAATASTELNKEGVSFYHQLNIDTNLSIDARVIYDPATAPAELGISQARAAEMGLAKSPRSVAWIYGILSITGQNKGGILRVFLKDKMKDFDAIVLVDDTLKNVKAVEDAFADTPIKVVALHYIQVAPADASDAAKLDAYYKDQLYIYELNHKN